MKNVLFGTWEKGDLGVLRHAPDNIDSFFDFIETKYDWQRPLLEHLECNSTEARLHEFLSSGAAIIKFTLASDGGARDDLGSYGWEVRSDARSYGYAKARLSDYSLGRFELSLTDSYQHYYS